MTFFPLNKERKKKDKWGYCAVACCPSRGQCAPALGTNNFLFSSQWQFNDPNAVVTLTHIQYIPKFFEPRRVTSCWFVCEQLW